MSTTILGKVSMTPKGAWNAGTSYEPLDVVSYGGSAFLARRANSNVTPTEGEDWQMIAEKATVGNIAQTTGTDTEKVMSQKAATDSFALTEDLSIVKQSIGIITLSNPFSRYGNFEDASDWYGTDCTINVSDNVATFSANSIYSGIRPLLSSTEEYKTSIIKDHIYYFFATIKSQKSNAVLSFNGSSCLGGVSTKGTGDWEFIDKRERASKNDRQPYSVTDNNTEFGSEISAKKMGYIDLTACYGIGNEPDYDTVHAILVENDCWINGKIQISSNIQERISNLENDVAELKAIPEKISKCKVFIFGDSITATNNIGDDGSLTNIGTNWTTYAMNELGIVDWYNFAKDGSTYHDVANSASYQTFFKQFELAKSKNITPDIIIVSYGTNDYQHLNTDTYESVMNVQNIDDLDRTNLHGALRYCYWALREKYPNAVIFVGTPIQRPDTSIYTDLRQAIIEMANTYCLHIIDAGIESGICKQFETWGSAGRYLKDGLHPNEEGKKLQGHFYANCIRNNF